MKTLARASSPVLFWIVVPALAAAAVLCCRHTAVDV